jgi:hypothetical protein
MSVVTVEGYTTTAGTGPITIAGTVPGYQPWTTVAAGIVSYAVIDGIHSESGWGKWDGASILTRISITHSTHGGEPISLSGNQAIVLIPASAAPKPGSQYLAQPQGSLIASNNYTASGAIPILGSSALVRLRGGAGASGSNPGQPWQVNITSGTGSPGWLQKRLTGLTVGNTLTLTFGAGGVSGAATGGNGGSTILASGSQAIATLTAGGSLGGPGNTGSPTAGGVATGGDVNEPGAPGIAGIILQYGPFNLFGSSNGAYAYSYYQGQPGVTPHATGAPGGQQNGAPGMCAIDWYE